MKLGLLIAYYPTRIPDPKGRFPSSVQVLVHLTGHDIGVVKHSQMVGIQGKRRVVQRSVDPGLGAGRIGRLAYPSYTYSAQPGFAEHDLDEYDRIGAELAWSRSLAAARKAFNHHANLERIVDESIQGELSPSRFCCCCWVIVSLLLIAADQQTSFRLMGSCPPLSSFEADRTGRFTNARTAHPLCHV